MKEAYVALGANLGERERSLAEAIDRLRLTPGIEVRRISAVYETEPVGYTDQPAFLNMAAAIRTDLAPVELLRKLLQIEKEMGRVRDVRWGPRTIDLDLLLYEDVTMQTDVLTLPHPRMGERAFVLVPLRDVWPNGLKFPWQTVLEALRPDETGIRQWGTLDESR
ncbi:2-amino-4-hydroxy-6-hydroxymethyldihydropteridine diphosphokinase [Cohnella pontilimi]|uniref:2-amino-4-hydroxy-6-hydroxymethyldihydropteridine diphosphokinase n=1 Tax=Cohnella pontilimi TaxID=2564100 RepID=A0A4U0F291_9BACL|nr:2-amino-4-hydroxy-6-hydroxymethyldihydropteridine diphosphokinase [Cohnella pontilimi]TJY38543.1 2-amino-4-hydroxy-6-hydroxymethyldihydropteridine diphosphokinase [Cohnella pontilimi]